MEHESCVRSRRDEERRGQEWKESFDSDSVQWWEKFQNRVQATPRPGRRSWAAGIRAAGLLQPAACRTQQGLVAWMTGLDSSRLG